ncbi:hypothetical protein IPL85_05550 [Candidatus Saccharibacteria bacterium]|nr:MAG: hypothetical protein IPL85_05550 [Candidatus Saccharibacteria bacterium]
MTGGPEAVEGIMSQDLAEKAHEAAKQRGVEHPRLGSVVVYTAVTDKRDAKPPEIDPLATNSYKGPKLPQTD